MAPVLRDTPRSHWLLVAQEDDVARANNGGGDVRAANLSTSLWLASTSHGPLTCVTRSTNNKKATIEWPSILFRQSPDLWLAAAAKGAAPNSSSSLDNWLAKRDNLDNWLASADRRRCQKEEEEDLAAWLVATPPRQSEEKSPVEKWLHLAMDDDDGQMEEGEDDPQDDESSIAILEEDEEDFHVVGRTSNDFWLL
jgi:hypothetical protein